MSFMTIFITPKGFDREHIAMIQRNAIRSWKALGNDVDIMLIGDDPGVEENAEMLGVRFFRDVRRNSSGTPMLDDIFRIARENSDSPVLAYVNADIILKKDFSPNKAEFILSLIFILTLLFRYFGKRKNQNCRSSLLR